MKRIDKIRQMSSEELAKALVDTSECENVPYCKGCLMEGSEACCNPEKLAEWLEEEVQEDA